MTIQRRDSISGGEGIAAVLLTLLLLTASSCTSTGGSTLRRTEVIGVVYDEQGQSVAGATLLLGRRQCGPSDMFGRFRCARIPTGPASVRASAPGYETVEQEIAVYARRTLVRIELVSLAALVDEAISAAHSGHLRRLQELFARATAIDDEDRRVQLLADLIARLEGVAE